MSPDVRGFYAALGVELPNRPGAADVAVRCFANAEGHRHGDRNPSCSVSVESGAWHCHGCTASGGAYDAALALGHTGAAPMDLLKRHGLAEGRDSPTGHRSPSRSPRPVARRETGRQSAHAPSEASATLSVQRLKSDPAALARLTELRGWSEQAVRSLGLGLEDGRVVFPVRDGAGTLAGALSYEPDPERRNGKPKMLAASGTPRLPFPAPESVQGDMLYVVEGEPDAVALATLGLPGVALPGAGKRDPEWWPRLAAGRSRVVFVADLDPAGRALMAEAAAAVAATGTEARLLDLAPLAESTEADAYDLGDALRECATAGSPPETLRRLIEAAAESTPPLPPPGAGPAAEPAVARAKLRVLDVARMLSTPPPPVPYVVEPLAVKGTLTMLAGTHGTGKSMLALALATATGHGAQLAGMDCKQGTALYVDAENGEHEAHRRLHGFGADADRLVYVEADGFHLGRDLADLDELLKRYAPTLLVLDSLRSLWPGGDENDSGEVAECIDPLRNLVRRHGAAALLLHHAGKGGSYDYRGSTALGASVELGFTLARHAEDSQKRNRRELRCWKCRPAPEPEARWVALEAQDGRATIGTAGPYLAGPGLLKPVQASLREPAVALLDQLGDDPITTADFARALDRDPSDRTVRELRDSLATEGVLTVTDGTIRAAAGAPVVVSRPKGQYTTTPPENPVSGQPGSSPESGSASEGVAGTPPTTPPLPGQPA